MVDQSSLCRSIWRIFQMNVTRKNIIMLKVLINTLISGRLVAVLPFLSVLHYCQHRCHTGIDSTTTHAHEVLGLRLSSTKLNSTGRNKPTQEAEIWLFCDLWLHLRPLTSKCLKLGQHEWADSSFKNTDSIKKYKGDKKIMWHQLHSSLLWVKEYLWIAPFGQAHSGIYSKSAPRCKSTTFSSKSANIFLVCIFFFLWGQICIEY